MFRVGDRVRIVKKNSGNICDWISMMDETIGSDGKIEYVGEEHVRVCFEKISNDFSYDFDSVELIENTRWRAENGSAYFHVDSSGRVLELIEYICVATDRLYVVGNYFQSEEEAKASKFYRVFKNK